MVGAGVEMLLDSRGDRCLIAPRDDRIDQCVRAAAGKIIVAPTEPAKVLDVVGSLQVEAARVQSCQPARFGRDRTRALQRAPERGAFPGRGSRGRATVCSTGTKYGWAPSAAVAGQLEHPRSQRGKHDRHMLAGSGVTDVLPRRHAGEVVAHRRERALVASRRELRPLDDD